MMLKRIKKSMKIILIFILCMTIFQSVRFVVEKRIFSGFELNEESNYVLMHEKNGLSTFPFVFGKRLYLYEIETGQKELLVNTILPFTEIGSDIALTKDAVYYNIPIWDDGFGYYYALTKNGEKEMLNIDSLYLGYAVFQDKIYYEREDFSSEEYDKYNCDLHGEIYVTDLGTGKESLFLDEKIGAFRVIEDKMFCYELEFEKTLIVDLNTGNVEEDSIDKFESLEKREEDLIEKIKKDIYSEEKVYLENMHPTISYCKDYIAIELYYYSDEERGDHSDLLIYDYEGNLIKQKNIW